MTFLLTIFSSLKLLNYRNDDDVIDRMHYLFSKYILVGMSILVSFKQFGGKPMECFAADVELPSGSEEYIESLCWADNTYFVPFDNQVSGVDPHERRYREINYYQWVPFFLLLQAACFQIPYMLWNMLSPFSGINIQNLVRAVREDVSTDPAHMSMVIDSVAGNLGRALRFHKNIIKKKLVPHRCLRVLNLPYCSFYVTFIYFLVKFLYLVNVIGQFLLINIFLLDGKAQSFHGFGAIKAVLNSTEWDQTGLFPRVTMCDFKNRIVGNLNTYTVQCVLVINIFNEKIFIFLWFWFLLLIALTILSIIYWFFTLFPCCARDFVQDRLDLADQPFDANDLKDQLRRFVQEYLRVDGVFTLKMISHHTSVIFACELTASLWRKCYKIEEDKRQESIQSGTPFGEKFHIPPKSRHNWGKLANVGTALFKNKPKKDSDSDSDDDRKKDDGGPTADNCENTQLEKKTSLAKGPTAPQTTYGVGYYTQGQSSGGLPTTPHSQMSHGQFRPNAPQSGAYNRNTSHINEFGMSMDQLPRRDNRFNQPQPDLQARKPAGFAGGNPTGRRR